MSQVPPFLVRYSFVDCGAFNFAFQRKCFLELRHVFGQKLVCFIRIALEHLSQCSGFRPFSSMTLPFVLSRASATSPSLGGSFLNFNSTSIRSLGGFSNTSFGCLGYASFAFCYRFAGFTPL